MPRVFEYIFEELAKKAKVDDTFNHRIKCSYLEIYNECIIDLVKNN